MIRLVVSTISSSILIDLPLSNPQQFYVPLVDNRVGKALWRKRQPFSRGFLNRWGEHLPVDPPEVKIIENWLLDNVAFSTWRVLRRDQILGFAKSEIYISSNTCIPEFFLEFRKAEYAILFKTRFC